MLAKVTLTIATGTLAGKEFVFEGPTKCTIGRSAGCDLQLPSDPEFLTVSRHHCLLEVSPPDARVRDLGSRNGTYVNGALIGCGDGKHPPEEAAPGVPPEWSLGEGDELGVGPVRFRVHVFYPVLCEDCWEEIPEDQLALAARTDFGFRCLACTQEAEKRARPGERSGEMMGML